MRRMLVRRSVRIVAVSVLLSLVAVGPAVSATAPSGPPTALGRGGAAATVERLATDAAIEALRQGGNAVDGTVVAAAVLDVTEPLSGTCCGA